MFISLYFDDIIINNKNKNRRELQRFALQLSSVFCLSSLGYSHNLTSVRRRRKMEKIAKRFFPFFAICAALRAAQMALSNSR
ncbi:hypothetical protein [Pseudanabaena sp. Chao 1811]|uniref:hypothetical protein n=1 Tax=Pseudanabaena sp. Chao 1811 TaxID=2963092 RepID=UPI0022F3DFF4|nr:hypothetical protein [Pseudanabaena sp. Chao 1811]